MEPSNSGPATATVFVSYSRKDMEFVKGLCRALEEDGRDVWVDLDDIPPSAEWLDEIYRGIEAQNACIFVLSPDYLASSIGGLEIAHAASHNKRLVPVVARDIDDKAVPEVLRRLNWIPMRAEDDFAAALAKLRAALDVDLPWVRLHTRLLVRAQEWEAKGRDTSRLLRGRDLKEAERWLSEAAHHPNPQPAPLQLEYMGASRRADKRRQRIVLGSTVIALLISTVLTIWALRERNVAQRQTQLSVANNLLIESQSERHAGDSGAQLRILMAVESLQRLLKQGRASTEALETMDAVASLRARKLGAAKLESMPAGIALSDRGDRVATWTGKHVTVRLTLGMKTALDVSTETDVTAAAFDPLATTLAVGIDGNVHLYDLSADATGPAPLACKGRPYALQFDATGKHVAALTFDTGRISRLCLWSAQTRGLLAELKVTQTGASEEPQYGTFAFSASSRFLAALLPVAEQQARAVLLAVQSGAQHRAWDIKARYAGIAFRGDTLVFADDQAVWGWSASEDREVSRWNLDQRARVFSFSRDGRFASVLLESGRSWVMDDFGYQRFGVFDTAGGFELAQMEDAPYFTADGRYLIAGDALREFPSMRLFRVVPESAKGMRAFSNNGAVAVTVAQGNEVTAWTLAGSPEVLRLPLDPRVAMPRAVSAHGPWFAFASARELRLVNLLDPARVTDALATHRVEGLLFSEKGRYLAGVGEGQLTLWELPRLTKTLHVELGSALPAPAPCAPLDSDCRRAADQPWLRAVEPLFISRDERFIAWTAGGALKVWTMPRGTLSYSSKLPIASRALAEVGTELLIGRSDGRVSVLETQDWQSRPEITLPLARIDALFAVPDGRLVAALGPEAEASKDPAKRSLVLFSPQSRAVRTAVSDVGVPGPWSRDARLATSRGEMVQIVGGEDGTRVQAKIQLKRSVVQQARPLAFTSDGRFLLVKSATPITSGESEPTLHIVDVRNGAEVLRFPVRDVNADSIQVDRGVPYPDDLFVDGTPDIVGALVYKNADAYWSLAASKGDKRLTIWSATAGTIVPKLAVPVTAPVRLAAFAGKGRFAVTVPQFNPEVSELPHYALSVWAIGVEERLHLACLAAGGEMAAADWDRYIGDFTGEAPRATCATR